MTRATLTAILVASLLGGCAIPGWVPVVGKKRAEPAAAGIPVVPPAAGEWPPPSTRPKADVDEAVLDRVVAVVNNDAITLAELQENLAVFRQENRERTTLTDDEILRQFLLRLIEERLQLQEAEREKIGADDAEVEEELTDRMKRMNVGGRTELEALLKAHGLTVDAVKSRVRDAIRISKVVRRKVALRVSVTEPEIDQYLRVNRAKLETGLSYHARHILVQPEGGDSDAAWEAARIRAELIRTELLAGADFTELARQHSRDASARDGGDLGTLKRGELAQEVEAEILALAPGEVGRPFRSALGYHIFRLESKETLEGDGLARARQQVRDILFRQKYESRRDTWLKEIRQRAIIDVRL
jgi:peptidyl-prolyl cis-trans isomerase SurA